MELSASPVEIGGSLFHAVDRVLTSCSLIAASGFPMPNQILVQVVLKLRKSSFSSSTVLDQRYICSLGMNSYLMMRFDGEDDSRRAGLQASDQSESITFNFVGVARILTYFASKTLQLTPVLQVRGRQIKASGLCRFSAKPSQHVSKT